MSFGGKLMELEIIMLREVRHGSHVRSHVCHLKLGDIKLNAGGSLIARISAFGADGGTLFPP
jgi:hypothetical protein